ncbi:16S rRNA (guanine(527)-N(7))-methyltransferase RsmG [Roseateles toxinivorans]|uniref:Ribosomal RNA small subunit methyltransferase G n=1 Tax=Roseateles toxinivorans TaxID=270368 RepID=A0A4R6QNC4_9BURK|nr:16S rRNA (guanine(527)-N(7))-methyltransferase RsmG [Roseateles toxinivorans]TDP72476.1 16S rRNA m(7)G-527 methyltransferase [Roseateles toxinivorans]
MLLQRTPDLREPLTHAANQLGLTLSETQVDRLQAYLALIHKWNQVYNLTAVRQPAAMLTQHLVDSLSLVEPLRRHTQGRALRVLDVGSGGGLPGVVLAIVMPELTVVCVDAVAKKTSFIQQVAAELRLSNLRGEHSRVEQLKIEPFDVITSRAFASLVDFTQLTRQHLKADAIWLAMKGQMPQDEIAALPSDVTVFHVEQLDVPGLDAQRCLVWLRPTN